MDRTYLLSAIVLVGAFFFVVGAIVLQNPEPRIDFKVTDKMGMPLAYMQIEIWQGSEEVAAAQTNNNGENFFHLANGSYKYNIYDRANGLVGRFNQDLIVQGPEIIFISLTPLNSSEK